MAQPIEDIQNRIRNHLVPFQTAIDILRLIRDGDQNELDKLIEYIKKTDLPKTAQKQIDWFISLGAAMDIKINDKNFNVEEYILNNV